MNNTIKISEILDPLFPNQWNLKLMNISPTSAWQYSLGENVVVGIIDSGIDGSHKDLGWDTDIYLTAMDGVTARKNKYKPVLDAIANNTHPKILPGWNFVENNNDTWDSFRHGTYLAGTIAAESDGFGMVGVAPRAKIRSYVVIDSNGYGDQTNIANAIKKAIDDKCDVINLSLVVPYLSDEVKAALEYSNPNNTIIVAATGNDNSGNVRYPAAHPNTIAVGGCNSVGERWVHNDNLGSNYGDEIWCIAPGAAQTSTYYMRSRFEVTEGTSQAAANLSGVIALLKSIDKNLTIIDIKELLKKYGSRAYAGWHRELGWGFPNVNDMLKEISSKPIIDLESISKQLLEIADKIKSISNILDNTSPR
jgi:subtilisin family serine protease